MKLNRSSLCDMLPHAGEMCLLDRVLEWDRESITCAATSHLEKSNPLRDAEGLPAICGIEYGAQAIALHSCLAQPEGRPASGYLAAARSINIHARWLHDVDDPLQVSATKVMSDQVTMIYRFSLESGGKLLVDGRITIVNKAGV